MTPMAALSRQATNRCCRVRRGARAAMTLMEVLLTTALIVVLAALAMPAMTRPLANQRLRSAAEQIRADWTRTRVKAMSTGRTWIFRYLPEQGHYTIELLENEELDAESLLGETPLEETAIAQTPVDGPPPGQHTLPEDVTFHSGESDANLVPRSDWASVGFDPTRPAPTDSEGLSNAIVFYPDGTTSSARVRLQNQYHRAIELSLRALTGSSSAGDVLTLPEM